VARATFSSRRERGNMDDLRSLRTKVERKKRPFWRPRNHPVPESPPEPLQCEHCLGNILCTQRIYIYIFCVHRRLSTHCTLPINRTSGTHIFIYIYLHHTRICIYNTYIYPPKGEKLHSRFRSALSALKVCEDCASLLVLFWGASSHQLFQQGSATIDLTML